MTKPIILKPKQWEKLKNRLQNDHSPSVILIRDKMRTTLGFVDREHSWWHKDRGHQVQICLDFFDDPKRTMFLLKYSEYIKNEDSISQ